MWPLSYSMLLSHGNDCSLHRQTHRHAHCEVGTGQGCSSQRGRLTSENSLNGALGSDTSLGETANEKARGPRPKVFFFSPFQGKMPRAIRIASSNWMEKADVPHSGLREVRTGRNAFRNALRDMEFTVDHRLLNGCMNLLVIHAT